MSKIVLVLLLLAPFVAWDVAIWVMRERGDRSTERRNTILRHFTEEDISRGREHIQRHNRLFPISRIIFYVFYGLLLFGGLGRRLEGSLLSLTGDRWYLALPLFILAILLARTLLHLPLSAWREFVIERQLGLSTITVGTWLADLLKSLLLGVLFGTLLALPTLALIRALPHWWPALAAIVILTISAIMTWIAPWVISPLFNTFTPLEDERLKQRVQSLSAEAGLKVKQVYVMDASRRSLYLNAYFTGLGNSRRVVLYDTLVEECSDEEVLSVVAHELGHWRGQHIIKGFVLGALGVIVGLWLLWGLLNWEAARTFFGLSSPASLVLVVLLPFLASLGGTFVSPVGSAISRHFERQADRTALELTRDTEAFISLEKRLIRKAKADLLQPRLLHDFYGSHPLPEERIDRAEQFR